MSECWAGVGAFRAKRKQALKTRLTSETRALSAKRNSDFLVVWAAARMAAKAGHVSEMSSVVRSKPCAAGREKAVTGSVGSRSSTVVVLV